MILKRSTTYWATGISVHWAENACRDENGERTVSAWGGLVEFYDDGFVDDEPDGDVSTEGELRTRYLVRDGHATTGLRAVIDTLIADASRLGIEMKGSVPERPYLFYKGDGESGDYPPPDGWREMLAAEAARIGWATPYRTETAGS